jgi:hypothetical protein
VNDEFRIAARGASISAPLDVMADAYFDSLARRMATASTGT